MAGTKPGPAKGKGGRPRKAASAVATRADGYKRVTVGPKGKGEQMYAHRDAKGLKPGSGTKSGRTGGVVDHKNHKRGDNRKANLRVTSKAGNNRNK